MTTTKRNTTKRTLEKLLKRKQRIDERLQKVMQESREVEQKMFENISQTSVEVAPRKKGKVGRPKGSTNKGKVGRPKGVKNVKNNKMTMLQAVKEFMTPDEPTHVKDIRAGIEKTYKSRSKNIMATLNVQLNSDDEIVKVNPGARDGMYKYVPSKKSNKAA